MKLSNSDQKLLDALLDGVKDSTDNEALINDSNFESMKKELNDSLFGALSNAGIAIAEQKKLLQGAKSPSALLNAIKLLAVTAGNLTHASTSMLSWMGDWLNKPYGIQRDSKFSGGHPDTYKVDDSAPFENWSKHGYEVHYETYGKDGKLYAILFRPGKKDYIVASGYNTLTGGYESGEYEFSTMSKAEAALSAKLGR